MGMFSGAYYTCKSCGMELKAPRLIGGLIDYISILSFTFGFILLLKPLDFVFSVVVSLLLALVIHMLCIVLSPISVKSKRSQ